MTKNEKNKRSLEYERNYIQRVYFKFNKRTENPAFLAMWNAVENKSDCLHYLISRYIGEYLTDVQGMSSKELKHLMYGDTPEARERKAYDEERRILAQKAAAAKKQ